MVFKVQWFKICYREILQNFEFADNNSNNKIDRAYKAIPVMSHLSVETHKESVKRKGIKCPWVYDETERALKYRTKNQK